MLHINLNVSIQEHILYMNHQELSKLCWSLFLYAYSIAIRIARVWNGRFIISLPWPVSFTTFFLATYITVESSLTWQALLTLIESYNCWITLLDKCNRRISLVASYNQRTHSFLFRANVIKSSWKCLQYW